MQSEPIAGGAIASRFYPQATVNITNRCNLRCSHCFVYRDGNPNQADNEPDDDGLLVQIRDIRDRHHIGAMLWMGGEPLIRKSLLRRGLPLFPRNTITTNGTIPLVDFSDVTGNLLYVVSLDGPEILNDSIRGAGVFQRVMENMSRLPGDFPHPVQCQCVVTKRNQQFLPEFVDLIASSPFRHLTFSFHVPSQNDDTGNAWASVRERDTAVRMVLGLKEKTGGLIRNRTRSLEMMLSENRPEQITGDCPAKQFVLPLYLSGQNLVSPFCCYGNDVDCSRCGAWVVFELAAAVENPAAALRRFQRKD